MEQRCVWTFEKNVEHIGEIKNREISFFNTTLVVPLCVGCFNKYNRVSEISKENKCDGEKALELLYKELDEQ